MNLILVFNKKTSKTAIGLNNWINFEVGKQIYIFTTFIFEMKQQISTWLSDGIDFNGTDAHEFLMGEGYEEVKEIYLNELKR